MNNSADQLTYLQEYIELLLEQSPMKAMETWGKYFTTFRENGQYNARRRMLQGIKRYNLPPYGVGIVRYGEG